MTALAVGVRVEAAPGLRTYATLLHLGAFGLNEAIERESRDNPWLEIVERSQAPFSEDELARIAAPGPSLWEHLERQIVARSPAPAIRAAALVVAGTLDERGYLRDDATAIAKLAQVSPDDAERAIAFVQSLEPCGVAARSLGERLRLQLADAGIDDAETVAATYDLERLARDGASHERVIANLRRCDRDPVRDFAPPVERAFPEFAVVRTPGGLEMHVRGERWPDVRVAALPVTRGLSEPMREARARARTIVDALARRKTTLERLGATLFERQRAYFCGEGDPALLVPLSGRALARELACSESTVSRAIGNRYVETPFGTIALRSLLAKRPGNVGLTTRAVRERVHDIVATAPHLSDAAIARMLGFRGIRLARRTVAKYRAQLGVPSLRERGRA